MSTPMVVVAGYGNLLRGDDGAGCRVAEALAARWQSAGDAVCVLAGHQPLPEWVPALAGAKVAYFVDAAPGTCGVALREVSGAGPDAPAGLLDGHACAADGLLTLCQALFGRVPRAFLVTLPAEQLGFSAQLSDGTRRAVAEAVDLLDRRVAAELGAGSCV